MSRETTIWPSAAPLHPLTAHGLLTIRLPLLKSALAAAAILVFVDSLKELPATLLLRPFNFDTLATMTYGLASLEQFDQSAPHALTIVLAGYFACHVADAFPAAG